MNVQGGNAEVRMVVTITRAATGKVEMVELVGHLEGMKDGSDTLNGGAECSDGRGNGTDRDQRAPEVPDCGHGF